LAADPKNDSIIIIKIRRIIIIISRIVPHLTGEGLYVDFNKGAPPSSSPVPPAPSFLLLLRLLLQLRMLWHAWTRTHARENAREKAR